MKDRIITNNLRNIKKSFLRFLSLLVMGALGVFAFTGLMAVAPDMINSLDRFLDERNNYDIKIISDMGLDRDDVDAIEGLSSVEKAEGVLYRDSQVLSTAGEYIVNINSIPADINLIEVSAGRLPQEKNEIAVEENYLKINKAKIGDTVSIEDEEGFYETDVIITGVVNSPLFFNAVNIDANRGNTNVGSGIINFYAYVPESNFKADYISTVYATVVGAKELETGSDAYKELTEKAIKEIEGIRASRESSRYESIMQSADEKIENESADAKMQLDDAKNQLEDAKSELDMAAKTISDSEKQLLQIKDELDKATEKLEGARIEISGKETELEEGRSLLEDAGRQIGEKQAQLYEADRLLAEGYVVLQEKQSQFIDGKAQLEAAKIEIDDKQRLADEGAKLIEEGERELEDASAQLENAKEEAAAAREMLDEKQAQADEARAQLDAAGEELQKARAQLDEGEAAFDYMKKDYDSILSSEHLTEDIIESEMARVKNDVEAVSWVFERLVSEYKSGTLTPEKAIAIIEEAVSLYKRDPTILEKLIFYRVAMSYLEPVINEGEAAYSKGMAELEAGEAQLEEGEKAIEEGRRQYDEAVKQIEEGEEKLKAGKLELEQKRKELEDGLKKLADARRQYNDGQSALAEGEELLNIGLAEYEANKAAYDEGVFLLEGIKKEYIDGVEELLQGTELIEDAKAQLAAGEREYNEGRDVYTYGREQLENGKKEYEEGYSKYRSGLSEYESGRANFDEEIKKAREEAGKIKMPTWYIYDRTGNQTYADYFDDAGSIRNLSRVFPIVFFLVAVLVSLISMSRMVEMDRMEIGTLKSMGYSREKVITKYAFFSILATFIGAVIGATLGLIIMPTVIFNIYGMLFDIPRLYLSPNWPMTLVGFFTVMGLVVGAGMFKAVQVMREKPADLLRPKAPKPGKRVLLERIEPLWKKFRFSDKITVRNLFRYKRRFFVTVFGIVGCTSLILCGFGLKDAIVDIPDAQFEKVFEMDAMVYLTGVDNSRRDSEKLANFFDEKEITGYTETQRIKCLSNGYEANMFVFERSEDIGNVLTLTDSKTGKTIEPEPGKVIITYKLAKLSGLKAGDEITMTDLDHVEHRYTISGVIDNYFEHNIILDKDTLEKYVEYAPNLFFINTVELTEEQQDDLTRRLLQNPNILNVTYKEKLVDNSKNMLTSLDKVVVILILLSAALSLVVLYNLSNININERHREIATLKVLGFYDKEVDAYINRENIIVTIIGIALGLLVGFFLTKIVVSTVEIEKACFINRIKPLSYVLAIAMSASFTLLVNWITHFNLKKINMIDSLKSVE